MIILYYSWRSLETLVTKASIKYIYLAIRSWKGWLSSISSDDELDQRWNIWYMLLITWTFSQILLLRLALIFRFEKIIFVSTSSTFQSQKISAWLYKNNLLFCSTHSLYFRWGYVLIIFTRRIFFSLRFLIFHTP